MNEDIQQLLAQAGIKGNVEHILSGAINDNVVFSDNGKKKVFRCRVREDIFGYEKGFMKEPLIAKYLAAAYPFDSAANEKSMSAAAQSIITAPVGRALSIRPLPTTNLYDFSRAKIPFLWLVQEYEEGPLLIEKPDEEKWRELGHLMGRLHTMQLSKAGPFDDRTQTPLQRVQSVWDRIQKQSPVPVTRKFDLMALAKGMLSLCHGDVHGGNVVVGSSLTLLDWDNAVADFPELDLVKPRHWCVTDARGFFAPHEGYYAAYRASHANSFGKAPDLERLDFYELSWLCRVYRFEEQRESAGRKPSPPYPAADSYVARIKELAL